MFLGGPNNFHRNLVRSASTTPPISAPASNVSDWLNAHHEEMVRSTCTSHNNNDSHAPLSPQSSVTSSGSGSDLHDDPNHPNHRNTFTEQASGMKGKKACWTKTANNRKKQLKVLQN